MRVCSYENCYFTTNEAFNQNLRIKWIYCAGCHKKPYHSEICMLNDIKHRNLCKYKIDQEIKPIMKNPSKSLTKIFRTIKEFKVEMNNNLGVGSFGTVLGIEHLVTGTKYAVKISYKSDLFEKKLYSIIQNEIYIHHKLKHPHIIAIKYVAEDDLKLYLIMELAENGNLAQYLYHKKRIEEKECFIYFFQTSLAIEY